MNEPLNVFISYSHKDEEYLRELENHIANLKRKNLIRAWSDREIRPGMDWSNEISNQMEKADLILLLVSASFLASNYIYGVELRKAIDRHNSGDSVVVPILLRPCDWHGKPFSKFQILPRNAKPISTFENKDLAYTEISENLERILNSVQPSEGIESTISIELNLDRDFANFSEDDKRKFINQLRQILETSLDVKITKVKKGSVKLRLKVGKGDIEKLYNAAIRGQLKKLDVVDAELVLDSETDQDETELDNRPSVFIGSSSEGLGIAESLQLNLDHLCEVTLWSQGVFGLGQGTLETLVKSIKKFDYAVLVLTPDDLIHSRGRVNESPRDNVIFELGLFMGHLGRERTFIVYDRTADIKIPSDLAGVTMATYQPHSSGNLEAALGAPSTKLKQIIKKYGFKTK